MPSVYLIGGGRGEDAVRASHAPFVHAVGEQAIVALVLDEGDDTDVDRWTGGADVVGRGGGARGGGLQGPPADRGGRRRARAACSSRAGGRRATRRRWSARARTGCRRDVVFGGFSAGAAIAGEWAIVGGWRHGGRDVCAEEAGEDLEQLTVRPGLGLVPFAVDVHATQWGTVTRLIHAVRAGLAPEGWAVDEGTVLVYDGDRVARRGRRLRLPRERLGGRPAPRGGVDGAARSDRRGRSTVAAWRLAAAGDPDDGEAIDGGEHADDSPPDADRAALPDTLRLSASRGCRIQRSPCANMSGMDIDALETSFDLVAPKGDELMEIFYSTCSRSLPR